KRQYWFDITFGLTEGWWRFQDRELRQDHPLLPVGAWVHLLGDTGFRETIAVPGPDSGGPLSYHASLLSRVGALDTPLPAADAPGTWLLFADAGGLGDGLGRQIVERGERIVSVRPGLAYEANAPDTYTIDPASPNDFVRLLADLVEQGAALR